MNNNPALPDRKPMDVIARKCERCGQTHDFQYRAINNPSDEWMWFAMCPTTNQPILLEITDKITRERWQKYHYGKVFCPTDGPCVRAWKELMPEPSCAPTSGTVTKGG